MITLNNINLSSIDLSGIDLRGVKLGVGGRGGGSGDGFPQLPGDVTRWHFGGLTNEMMAAMDDPRIEDADHKGRFLSFKNFAWKGMSGVGGYVVDIDEWGTNSTAAYFERNSIKITATFKENASLGLLYHNIKLRQSCVLKVTGIPEGCDAFLDDRLGNRFYMSEDGVYEIIPSNFLAEALYLSIEKYPERWYESKLTIEQLPLYPGALVFDGVDDYGTCDNFPILTKEKGYTVVALRQWISMGEGISGLVSNVKNWFNDGAFVLEYNSNNATNKFVNRPVSFGNVNIEMDLPNNFTYQTSKSYKGVPITTGSFKGTNSLFVGKLNNIIGNCSNVAIWELVFLDHDATEEELTKIKDYFVKTYPWLFPDQAWTVVGKTNEDEDRATIANITGNGNDLVLSNFGFIEGSGYNEEGEYAGYLVTDGVDDKIVSSVFGMGKDFTIVGEWKFIDNKKSGTGLVKGSSFYIYNTMIRLDLYINSGSVKNSLDGIKSINAACSDGRAYDRNWNEILANTGNVVGSGGILEVSSSGGRFDRIAFKNLAIYPRILSKDDCIKAYNYLQTLKAK